MPSGIYAIVNRLDNKMYVGSAINFQQRWSKHINELDKSRHHSPYLQYAYNKYGRDSFIFIVLEEVINISTLLDREQFWINFSKCVAPNGYNIAPIAGNVLGIKRSEETRKRMSIGQLKREAPSIETRQKLSSFAKRRKFSENTKLAMSKSQTGRKHSEETKLKMSLASKDKPKSAEHKIKNGLAKRTPDKWPHEKGNRCSCRECKDKRNDYGRKRYNEQFS